MRSKGFISEKTPDLAKQVSRLQERVKIARGDQSASLVIRNAKWLDVFTGTWQMGDVAIADGVIVGVADTYEAKEILDAKGAYLVPGFIDAHVHVESSMMTPARFAEAVLPRGTTSVIWDPHEIANVKGVEGIQWALDSTADQAVDFFVMVPSCVPSTSPELGLESSGASLTANDLKVFVGHPRVLGLAEMMNWPGLVGGDAEVMTKLALFGNLKRDGHCPGLSGKALNAYGVAGIHSCHESTSKAEAAEKLTKGIHVLIREGSCAKDADALLPLVKPYTSATIGYCSDDRNPLDIEETGHLDCIVNKALRAGIDTVSSFRAASFAVARMYGLEDRGAIAPGYQADLVLVRPQNSNGIFADGVLVDKVWKSGVEAHEALQKVPKNPKETLSGQRNLNIKAAEIKAADFSIPCRKTGKVNARVIGVRPGQIVTDSITASLEASEGEIHTGPGVNKIAVIERHHATGQMATAFVQGIGLKSGAIATSINHDCHNVIVTGSSDQLMAEAVKKLRAIDGGIVVVSEKGEHASIQLPIGGLMTSAEPREVAESLRVLKKLARDIGCPLEEPFLQLSFLALPVIPSLKITDRGLVDGNVFKIVPVVI